jgi:glycosyltransferase involved in cell wall biosynthesis
MSRFPAATLSKRLTKYGFMNSALVSILIPLYNEEEFIGELLRQVAAAPLPNGLDREIIVVDDGSNDGSFEVARDFAAACPAGTMQLFRHDRNRGKGAAIRTAIQAASGHYSIIQDADLEYDPGEYPKLLRPLIDGRADVVYGSRFMFSGERRVLYYWHSVANHVLTTVCNIAADVNLSDMETCYKAFRTSLAKTIPIQSDRFGIDPELTVKFARRRARIYETAISYHGRTYAEGKKIRARDAFEALWVIVRSRFTNKLHTDRGAQVLDALSFAPRFNRWMADTIAPWVGKRVLEIGAGTGNMTRHICPLRKIYIATDIDPESLEYLKNTFRHRPAVRVARLDAENPAEFRPFERQMDTIVCLNVLEHLRDDAGALERIRTVLESGGRLILLVPCNPAAYGTLDDALGHYRRYTHRGLAALLADAGYELLDLLEFNRVSYPGWRFAGQVLRASTLSPGALRIFDQMVWLWRKIDCRLPWSPASIIAIARRRD